MENLLTQIGTNVAFAVPLFIVYAFGALLALSRWQQHPRTSLFALGGLAALLIASLVSNIGMPSAVYFASERNATHDVLSFLLSIIRGVVIGLGTLGNALLLAAVFAKREPAGA